MDLHEEIGELTAPLLHRVLFVCFSEPVAGPEEILPHIPCSASAPVRQKLAA
jgi:hypothetical protein